MIIPVCESCGRPFKALKHPGPKRRFCDDRCRYRFHHPHKVKDRTRICLGCGRKYQPRWRGKSQRYCSPACAQKASRGKKHRLSLVTQKCIGCGGDFVRYSNANNQRWCTTCSENRRKSTMVSRNRSDKLNRYNAHQATLQKIWERKLKRALAADRQKNLRETARHLMETLNRVPRQWMIYDLVCNWGIPERIVAEKLGITQQGVSRVLAKILHKFPGLRPIKADCKTKGLKSLPEGFHRPGKTHLAGCERP